MRRRKMNRLGIYDIELFNEICDVGDYPRILGTYGNKLHELWGRNYKDVIKIETSMIIKGLKGNIKDDGEYFTNFYFEITPKQAEEMIETLQKILKNRKKSKS